MISIGPIHIPWCFTDLTKAFHTHRDKFFIDNNLALFQPEFQNKITVTNTFNQLPYHDYNNN